MDRQKFMDACAEGGRAFGLLFERVADEYAKRLFNTAKLLLRNPSEADDMVQITLIKAWQRCNQFRGGAELGTWLHSILRHTVLDHAAARRPELHVPWLDDGGRPTVEVEQALMAAAAAPADPETAASSNQRQRAFEDGFGRFEAAHPHEAAVLRLVALDELSMTELAALLDRSVGATREYVSQCRKKARPFLGAWLDQSTLQMRRHIA